MSFVLLCFIQQIFSVFSVVFVHLLSFDLVGQLGADFGFTDLGHSLSNHFQNTNVDEVLGEVDLV